MTQAQPDADAKEAGRKLGRSEEEEAEEEIRLLKSRCAGLAAQLHDLGQTRRRLSAQVSLLAVEAVEAGCRGELWITHEGKSNESRFHRVVPSSEITCGREGGTVRDDDMSSSGDGGGGVAKKGASKRTSPTNPKAATPAAAAAASTSGSRANSLMNESDGEAKHKLCSMPGCTRKEQGKTFGNIW